MRKSTFVTRDSRSMPVYRGSEAEAGRASAAWDHARRAMGRVVLLLFLFLFLFLRLSGFPGSQFPKFLEFQSLSASCLCAQRGPGDLWTCVS